MNTYVWRRWRELDQLVRHMTLANPCFNHRVADAPPRAVHVYALVMRSPVWAALHPVAASYQHLAADRPAQIGLLRDPANLEVLNGLAGVLASHKLEDLLALACPQAHLRLIGALDHCGDVVHEPAFYDLLVRLLDTAVLAPLLAVPDTTLDLGLLTQLRKRARDLGPLTLKAFALRKLSFHNAVVLQRVIDATVHVHGTAVIPVFANALENWNAEHAHGHANRLLNRLPAAPAPWEGDAELAPVKSTIELTSLGRRFRNCVAEYRLNMILGTQAFYVWTGPGTPAILSVSREPDGRWSLHELKGPRNDSVPPEQVDEIRDHLATGGLNPKISVARTIDNFRMAELHEFHHQVLQAD